jgi:enoyl-CoA hydratase
MAALRAEDTDWTRGVLDIFARVAPTSLKVTLEANRRGAGMEFEDCMVMEYRLSQSFLAADDFYEGVRALLIDKDKNPRWNPATLAAVDPERVERYFAVPAAGDLTFAG